MTLFPASDASLLICSPAGRILYVTADLRRQLEQDLVGRSLYDILPDSLVAELVAAAHAGGSHAFQCRICGKQARCTMEPRDGNMTISVFFSEYSDGPPTLHIGSAELLSREISSSLATMFAAYENLPEAETSKSLYAKQAINQGMYRLMRLSRNLLDSALAENGRLELTLHHHDLCEVCHRLCSRIESVLEVLSLEFVYDIPAEPLVCCFDSEKLERVLYNLFSNSIKHSRAGGRIRFSLIVRGENAVITVSDQGTGISSAVLPYVFAKHKAGAITAGLSAGGAGFGFSIARSVMALHGGTCVIASNEGQGTTVTLTLPLNLSGPELPLGSITPDYASGFDHMLLELSTALPATFYGKRT